MDFSFQCPDCAQPLIGSAELAGLEVSCPACGNKFHVTEAPIAARAGIPVPMRHWLVDARILVRNSPPTYIQMLVEVPNTWALPMDGHLPDTAFEVVKKAVSARYPQSPLTPTKIRVADSGSLRRLSEQADYCNDFCRAWLLGKPASVN